MLPVSRCLKHLCKQLQEQRLKCVRLLSLIVGNLLTFFLTFFSGISSDILVFFSEIKEIWRQHFWKKVPQKITHFFHSTPGCQRDTFMATLCLWSASLQQLLTTHKNRTIHVHLRTEAVKPQGCHCRIYFWMHASDRPAQKQLSPKDAIQCWRLAKPFWHVLRATPFIDHMELSICGTMNMMSLACVVLGGSKPTHISWYRRRARLLSQSDSSSQRRLWADDPPQHQRSQAPTWLRTPIPQTAAYRASWATFLAAVFLLLDTKQNRCKPNIFM